MNRAMLVLAAALLLAGCDDGGRLWDSKSDAQKQAEAEAAAHDAAYQGAMDAWCDQHRDDETKPSGYDKNCN